MVGRTRNHISLINTIEIGILRFGGDTVKHKVNVEKGKKGFQKTPANKSKAPTASKVTPRLFHGTATELKPGDIIEPLSKREKPTIRFKGTSYEEKIWPSSNFQHLSKPNIAYATEDLKDAKYFALVAARLEGEDWKDAIVYEVEPIGQTKVKRLYPQYEPNVPRLEHQSPIGFRVIAKVAHKTPPKASEQYADERLQAFSDLPWVILEPDK